MDRMIFHGDPFLDAIDCTEVEPIVDHPAFQRLGFIKQLGLAHLIFRQAQHTRLQHSLGAYERTKERMRMWCKLGIVDRETARDIEIFGLVHDIGHGPYSHTIEGVTSIDHDERGLQRLAELEKVINRCGGNYQRIKRLFSHRDPLYKAVHDKNLGTEKFDYLERDSAHTNSGKPQFRDLPYHIKFMKGEIVIDYRDDLLDAALHIQEFYMDMYKNVYMQTNSLILSRLMQKLVFHLLKAGELNENQLWEMVDADLDAEILNSKQSWIVSGGQKLRNRQWPKVAISIKQPRFAESETFENGKKIMSVFSVSARRMKKLAAFFHRNPRRIAEAEKEIEKEFGFPEHSVLIVPIADSQRFKAQQVKVYKEGEGISSLEKWRPEGVARLNEIAQSYMCLRVAVDPEHRERLANKTVSKAVLKYLLSESC